MGAESSSRAHLQVIDRFGLIRPTSSFFKSGVIGLAVLAITPFLYAQEESRDLIEVESLSSAPVAAEDQVVEFRPPIEEETDEFSGFDQQYQMQLLQQEVQQLRGMMEELNYQLQRMQATQDDRYLELDSRFQSLQEQISSGGIVTDTVAPADEPVTPADTGVVTSEVATEDQLYGTALEQIRARQYDEAIDKLTTLIAEYPDGVLIANAYYWLGEVHAAKPDPDYESARQALSQVITFFPQSNKVPDAGFKLGKVYHLMGDCERAEQLLTQVMEENAGRSVAQLAETYLREKVDCGS